MGDGVLRYMLCMRTSARVMIIPSHVRILGTQDPRFKPSERVIPASRTTSKASRLRLGDWHGLCVLSDPGTCMPAGGSGMGAASSAIAAQKHRSASAKNEHTFESSPADGSADISRRVQTRQGLGRTYRDVFDVQGTAA